MFLNNRYYDPGLGAFTSVDPLVGKTGTPYLYGAGNPATLSDPRGLEPCKESIECQALNPYHLNHFDTGYCAKGCYQVGGPGFYLTREDALAGIDGSSPPAGSSAQGSDLSPPGPGDYLTWIESTAGALSKDAVLKQTLAVDGRVTIRVYETAAGAALVVTEANVTMTVQTGLVPASWASFAGALAKTMKVAGAGLSLFTVGQGVLNGWRAYERSGGGYENLAASMIDNAGPPIVVTAAGYAGAVVLGDACASTGVGVLLVGGCAAVGGWLTGQAAEMILGWLK